VRTKILVVDDEPDALELMEVNLQGAGYEVLCAADGAQGLALARAELPGLILLDVMLPYVDGLEVCKALRMDPKTSAIPIIMLTARAAEVDRVVGLELGADDYVTKPFSLRELVLRVKNLLKRGETLQEQERGEQICLGDLLIDLPNHRASLKGKPLDLTLTEFKLITFLTQRKGKVQSRQQLLKDVWGYSSLVDTRTVDTHMRRLRDKLGDAAKYVDTVRGVGYRFVDE
jgi:DNA-binding response OmpR family regulator